MMVRNQKKQAEKAVELREKEAECIRLKLAGLTFDEIANRLKYANRSGAYKAFQRAMEATIRIPADEYRQLQGERLEELLKSLWPDASGGALKVIVQVRGIIKDLRELFGLDLPSKMEISSPDGAFVGAAMLTDEQLHRIAQAHPGEFEYRPEDMMGFDASAAEAPKPRAKRKTPKTTKPRK